MTGKVKKKSQEFMAVTMKIHRKTKILGTISHGYLEYILSKCVYDINERYFHLCPFSIAAHQKN